jgi:hypothetical protein
MFAALMLGAAALAALAHFGDPEAVWLVCGVLGACAR